MKVHGLDSIKSDIRSNLQQSSFFLVLRGFVSKKTKPRIFLPLDHVRHYAMLKERNSLSFLKKEVSVDLQTNPNLDNQKFNKLWEAINHAIASSEEIKKAVRAFPPTDRASLRKTILLINTASLIREIFTHDNADASGICSLKDMRLNQDVPLSNTLRVLGKIVIRVLYSSQDIKSAVLVANDTDLEIMEKYLFMIDMQKLFEIADQNPEVSGGME